MSAVGAARHVNGVVHRAPHREVGNHHVGRAHRDDLRGFVLPVDDHGARIPGLARRVTPSYNLEPALGLSAPVIL